MIKAAFIKLTRKNNGNTPVYVQVSNILGFGHAYGAPNGEKGYFIRTHTTGEGQDMPDMSSACWVVQETPEEIMTLIDKAQALVHALEQ